MKDVVFYVFLFLVYGILALNLTADRLSAHDTSLSWKVLGEYLLLFAAVATLARWTVMAFKRRSEPLLSGQEIVGIEEQEGDHVIDVVKPERIKRELKKPKLKRKRRF